MSIKEIGSTRIHNKSGYVFIKTEDGWIFQHRYVMEQVLNRKLLITEVVHHIDHNPHNNKIENLMLFKNNSDHKRYEAGENIIPLWQP